MLQITPATIAMLRSAQVNADEKIRATRAAAMQPKMRTLGDRRFEEVVKKVVVILRSGRASKFEFEAACRHGLRRALCLQGWRWQDADSAAAVVVDTALRQIGAVRPSWQQGQPEWTQDGHAPVERTRCVRCGVKMPPAGNGNDRKFCSYLCRNAHNLAVAKISGERVSRAEYFARKATETKRRREESEWDCEECGKAFVPRWRTAIHQRFCSPACKYASMRLPKKVCANCGTDFQPPTSHHKFCGRECSEEFIGNALRTKPRPCARCGTVFRRRDSRLKFCSKSCAMRSLSEATLDDRRPPKTCPICTTVFRVKPSSPKTFCSRECATEDRMRRSALMAPDAKPTHDPTHPDFARTVREIERGNRLRARSAARLAIRCEEIPPLAPDEIAPLQPAETDESVLNPVAADDADQG